MTQPIATPTAAAAAPFSGEWVDESGRRLTVEWRADALTASFADANGKTLRRRTLLPFISRAAANLPAVVKDGALVVELGNPGLGPTLHLTCEQASGGGASLIPEVRMGLYDDFEDDLGAPFVFPLSPYRRR